MDMNNQRAYSRGNHFAYEAKVSKDGENWHEAEVTDLSSGGLKLQTSVVYNKGDILWFDLVIAGFMSELDLKVQGEIRHVGGNEEQHHYGVRFMNLSPDMKIRIDTNVHNDRPVERGRYTPD